MKNIIFKLILILFCLQSGISQPIDLPWYHQYLTKNNSTMYAHNCYGIHHAENLRSLALIVYNRLTHKKADLDQVLNAIKTELADVESWMIGLEQEALLAIKEKYQMSDEIWQKYQADLHRMKTIYTKNMKQNHADVIHDPNVPADILEIIITMLQQNNINPQSLHIRMVSDQEEIDKNPHIVARIRTQIVPLHAETNIISYHYLPLIIELFPAIIEQSTNHKVALCAHEMQHLIRHHGLSDILLTTYLQHYYNIQEIDFKKSPEYCKFAQIHEAQAEILSAIADPNIAECLKSMRQTSYYPDHLYEDHFFHLAHINKLWKVHAWLEFFHQDGTTKIKNEWFNKVKMCMNSLQQQLLGC